MPTEDMKDWDERFAAWWSDRRVRLEEELQRQRRAAEPPCVGTPRAYSATPHEP